MSEFAREPLVPVEADLSRRWERWWGEVDTPDEIVWNAAEADLEADLDAIVPSFDAGLPVVDVGCGDGRQTRFLARHFASVVGVDLSPAAIQRAHSADNPRNVRYRVLDARDATEAARLHDELGDANVYTRRMLQAPPEADRPLVVETIGRILGVAGTLFTKELPPQASAHLAEVVGRHGPFPALARVIRFVPPGHVTEQDLAKLFPPDRFRVLETGASFVCTTNVLPDGEALDIPAVYALVRPLGSDASSQTRSR